jgi:hypothetical protein
VASVLMPIFGDDWPVHETTNIHCLRVHKMVSGASAVGRRLALTLKQVYPRRPPVLKFPRIESKPELHLASRHYTP